MKKYILLLFISLIAIVSNSQTQGNYFWSYTNQIGYAKVVTASSSFITNITETSANVIGSVIVNGGCKIIEKGFYWDVEPYEGDATNGIKVVVSTTPSLGTFNVDLTGLPAGSLIYFKAYAINCNGMSSGEVVTFNTLYNGTVPAVSTYSAMYLSLTSATTGGNVTNSGGNSVTSRGVCWNTTGNPTISDPKTTDGSGIGIFSSTMTGLTNGTTYYIRAYATNVIGTGYGNEVIYSGAHLPTIVAYSFTNVTTSTINVTCRIDDLGHAALTDKGIVWSTSTNPTLANSSYSNGSGGNAGTGYTSLMTGLSANTKYYIKPYGINAAGTYYGAEVNYTTPQGGSVPTVTTASISSITDISASGGGNVTSDGGNSVTSRGVVFSTTPSPTIYSYVGGGITSSSTGIGVFTSSLTGLICGSTYYVRAYATNSVGTSYGNEVSFNTTAPSAVVATLDVQDYETCDFANFYGNITSTGCLTGYSSSDPAWGRGFVWNTTQNPTLSSTISDVPCGEMNVTGTYFCSVNPQIQNTTYYVRAYVKSPYGTVYGSQVSFTTSCGTSEAFDITSTSAGHNCIWNGFGYVIIDGGIVCNTSPNATTSTYAKKIDGLAVGDTYRAGGVYWGGLTPNTTYYSRSYATTSQGTFYSNQVVFTTLP